MSDSRELEGGAQVQPLRLGFEFGMGKRGMRQTSRDSAIMRPFSTFIEGGGRVGGVIPVILDARLPVDESCHLDSMDPPDLTDAQALAIRAGPPRVFGSFALTPGKRLCFYPGLQELDVTGTHDDEGERIQQSMRIHHYTLEPDWKSWHITGRFRNESVKMPGIRHTWLRNWGIRWLAMTVPTASDFEPLGQYYVVNMGDAAQVLRKRAGTEFIQSMRGSRVIAPADARMNDGPFAWHFEILVTRQPDDSAAASEAAVLSSRAGNLYDGRPVRRRAHPIPIPGFLGTVWVNCSVVSGEVAELETTNFIRSGKRA